MMRRLRGACLGLLGIVAAGCAAGGPPTAAMLGNIPWPPPEYRHTISTDAVRQYWNCTRPEHNVVRVDGLAANMWSSQPVWYLTWELVGIDAAGRTVSSMQVKSPAIELTTNTYTPFHIELRTSGGETRFDLYYEYQFQDQGHNLMFSALDWDGPVLLAQATQRFFVRDACSESQHLAH
jgi:hypothetical protein